MVDYAQAAADRGLQGDHRRRRRRRAPARHGRVADAAAGDRRAGAAEAPRRLDSLLSIVQMPAGVPVATVSVGGARNAGLLAVRILAASDAAAAPTGWRASRSQLAATALEKDAALRQRLAGPSSFTSVQTWGGGGGGVFLAEFTVANPRPGRRRVARIIGQGGGRGTLHSFRTGEVAVRQHHRTLISDGHVEAGCAAPANPRQSPVIPGPEPVQLRLAHRPRRGLGITIDLVRLGARGQKKKKKKKKNQPRRTVAFSAVRVMIWSTAGFGVAALHQRRSRGEYHKQAVASPRRRSLPLARREHAVHRLRCPARDARPRASASTSATVEPASAVAVPGTASHGLNLSPCSLTSGGEVDDARRQPRNALAERVELTVPQPVTRVRPPGRGRRGRRRTAPTRRQAGVGEPPPPRTTTPPAAPPPSASARAAVTGTGAASARRRTRRAAGSAAFAAQFAGGDRRRAGRAHRWRRRRT